MPGGTETAKQQLIYQLQETYASHVFGDTFPSAESDPERMGRVVGQIGEVANRTIPVIVENIQGAGLELPDDLSGIMLKTSVFCTALLEGHVPPASAPERAKLGTLKKIAAIAISVATMYFGNQSVGRGDEQMEQAIVLLDEPSVPEGADPKVIARLTMLQGIKTNVDTFCTPEDVPYVLPEYYDKVLKPDARRQDLSRQYFALESLEKPTIPSPEIRKVPARPNAAQQDFLGQFGAELTDLATVNAGFPSISRSLYALMRSESLTAIGQEQPARAEPLAPLSALASDPQILELEQVCNVYSRILDDLGDWQMDAGHFLEKGIPVINPFNQYHPVIVDRFCELGRITNADTVAALHEAFRNFPGDTETHGERVLHIMVGHIQSYINGLPNSLLQKYPIYIDLCKRVGEISYINRIGDIELHRMAG